MTTEPELGPAHRPRRGGRGHRRLRRGRWHRRLRAHPARASPASCSRPGPFLKPDDYENDEWAAFNQMAWLDNRTASRPLPGRPRLPEPARLDRQGRRRLDDALVGRDPAVPGLRVQDPQPTTAASRARTCSTGRSPSTTWRRSTTGPRSRSARPTATVGRRCRRTTTTRCSPTGPRRSATSSTRPVRTAPTPSRTTAALPRSRTGSTSRATRAPPSGAPPSARSPGPSRPGKCDLRPDAQAVQITHDATRSRQRACSTSTRTATCTARRPRWSAWRATRSSRPRLLLMSASALHPDGLANSSGQVGRNYMRHTTGLGLRALRLAGAHVPRRDDGRDRRRRGPPGHLPWLRVQPGHRQKKNPEFKHRPGPRPVAPQRYGRPDDQNEIECENPASAVRCALHC